MELNIFRRNIYVYQTPDQKYGAGYLRRTCEARGRILEVLPINTQADINYVVSRGSNHGDVSDRVVYLAENARKYIDKEIEVEVREDMWIDLLQQPFWRRLKIAWKILRG